MMGKLDGKVAIITGAGAGIGRATSKLFASEGATVVVAELSDITGPETARLVTDAGGKALFVQTDVTKPESVAALITCVEERFGRLDILHNNAGGSSKEDGPVASTPLAIYERVILLNLTSVWIMCHHALPLMIKSGGGAIINTSSANALNIRTGSRHAYAAAKGGVISLTKAIAFDYAKHKIRANAIAPGLTVSERVGAELAASDAMRNALVERHPLGNGQPENVARLALYLGSSDSAFTTGQLFPVNNEIIG